MGYKAGALQSMQVKGLPVLYYRELRGCSAWYYAQLVRTFSKAFAGHWAVRTDSEINAGGLLPLYGSNKGNLDIDWVGRAMYDFEHKNSGISYIISEAPDDAVRDANIVCWRDGDYLFGEINFQPMTLRDAWVKGRLYQFVITGGPQDVLRNVSGLQDRSYIMMQSRGTWLEWQQFRLDYLRRIRELITEDFVEYEISVMNDARLIFWYESRISEDRSNLIKFY